MKTIEDTFVEWKEKHFQSFFHDKAKDNLMQRVYDSIHGITQPLTGSVATSGMFGRKPQQDTEVQQPKPTPKR